MTWLKIGGIAGALIAAFFAFQWAARTGRTAVEAEILRQNTAIAAQNEVRDAESYQAGLEDGRAMAKTIEKVKVIYKKVPHVVKVPGSCSVDPDAIRLRNDARRAAHIEAVSPAGSPDAVSGGDGAAKPPNGP